MLTEKPHLVSSGNLSRAWGEAFLRTMAPQSSGVQSPLLVSICDFDEDQQPREDHAIRVGLDESIRQVNAAARRTVVQRVEATSQTIFPHMCWTPSKRRPADELFAWYLERVLPRLRARSRANARGTYFERMIRMAGLKHGEACCVNQLGDILRWFRENKAKPVNKSMQLTLRDPARDHFPARAEFPCLHHVGFAREGSDLVAAAYYPTENIFERGYGNYLGLCRLASFVAHETHLRLRRVNVFVLQPRLDTNKSGPLEELVKVVRDRQAVGELDESAQHG